MIADDRNMRQLFYGQREGLSAAENRIAGQQHDWPRELHVTLWLKVPGLQGRKVIVTWANLCLPVEGHSLAVAKPIDDHDRNIIFSAGAVTDVDDEAVQIFKVTGNLIESGSQFALLDVFQLENANVTECPRPAVEKHPGLSFSGPPESVGDKSLVNRPEELLDLPVCELPRESGLFLCRKIAFPSVFACLALQLDMSVIQRIEHLAEDVEELVIAGLACDFGPIGLVLLCPVDVPQFEKWIPVVKGPPQLLEVLFGVANGHSGVDLSSPSAPDSHFERTSVNRASPVELVRLEV
jgi:hypothetical protein